ncbi:hypothetical protein ACU4GD_44220 [Cupriavidus basilensis]
MPDVPLTFVDRTPILARSLRIRWRGSRKHSINAAAMKNLKRERIMLKAATSVMFAMAIIASPVWAQTASGAGGQSHNDAIVKMRQEEAAARKEYKRKVAEAQRFSTSRKRLRKERDAAIAAPRAAAGQK